jgi:hypothetical protein
VTAVPPPRPPVPPPAPHPDPTLLERYAEGTVDPASAAAVELHLQVCEVCRSMVNTHVSPQRLATNWAVVDAVLDAPRRRLPERALIRLGVPAEVARLMGATPALRRSWFVAVSVALLFGLAAADPDRPDSSVVLLLALAPLVPVVGVALAYGPGVDPAYEVTLVTPISGFRLVLIRSAAVVATSLGLAGLVSLLVVARTPMAAAWLLPALALSTLCLALMTWLAPRVAGAAVSGGWLVTLVVAARVADDDLAAFGVFGQVAMAVVALAAAVVLVVRRGAFDTVPDGFGGST